MSSAMKTGLGTGLSVLLTAIVLWNLREKLHFDPAAYSSTFADQETHFGFPNFWNVATNAGFVLIGLFGFLDRDKFPKHYQALGTVFALAVLGTGFGSAYFHYQPTPTRLFWDQLPMSIGFASFVGMVIADRIGGRSGLFIGTALCLAGPWSVWNIYYGNGATEYYLTLQFGGLFFTIFSLLFTPKGKMFAPLVFIGLLLYIVAKVFETYDAAIFTRLVYVSGHSLKHVAATFALWAIFRGTVEDL